jgi:hypothetical protein
MGPAGVQGLVGPIGPAGIQGDTGPMGPAGVPGTGLNIYAGVQNNTANQTFAECEFITFPTSTLSSNAMVSADLTTLITTGGASAYLINYGIESCSLASSIQLYHNGCPADCPIFIGQMGKANASMMVLSAGGNDSWQVQVVGSCLTLPNGVGGFYMTIVGLN